MTFDDGSESTYVKADGLVVAPFQKGDYVYHVATKRYGVIVYGPDSDEEYKVQYYDDTTKSGYLKGSAFRGIFFAVGEKVKVRDGDDGTWSKGVVTQTGRKPKVQKDGWDSAHTWDQVCPL